MKVLTLISKYWLTALIILCVGFALLPLIQSGFIPTHDGEYHIIRFWQFHKVLTSGVWYPRWAPDLNSTYGVPLFNFHYPLPNFVGSLYHQLGVSLADSVKLVLLTGYLAALAGCYCWLKQIFTHSRAAFFGVFVVGSMPYWFVDMYVRGSVGEVLAFGFVFWALYALEAKKHHTLAVCITGLVLSHNIMAVVFVPVIGLYALVFGRVAFLWLMLGVAGAALFWIPAIAEREFVTGLSPVAVSDHFPSLLQLVVPSWGTGFSQPGEPVGEMSMQMGVQFILLMLMVSYFLVRKLVEQQYRLQLWFFLCVCGVGFFLMSEYSLGIWTGVPGISLIQYPWRLLSLLLPAAAFFAAYVFGKTKSWVSFVLIIVSVLVGYGYAQPVRYEPRADDHYLSRSNFTDGTSSLGNTFATRWFPYTDERPKEKIEIVGGRGAIVNADMRPQSYNFTSEFEDEVYIRVHTSFFPGWTVYADTAVVPIDYESSGLIDFRLPQGTRQVRIVLEDTPVRRISTLVSFLAFFVWLASGILFQYARRNR